MRTKAQNRATTKYNAKTYKVYNLRLRRDKYKDLIQKIDSQKSKNDYIIKALESYDK